MKKSILFLTLVFFLASTGLATAGGVLKFATEGAYPPFNYVKANGTPAGFDVDIIHALAKEMGLGKADYKVVIQDWDGMIPGLLAKKFDVMVASMSITKERKKAVAFTNPYYYETGSFLKKKGSNLKISRKGLKGKTIGTQTATIWGKYLEGVYGDIVKIKYYNSTQDHNLDLKAGRLDAALANSFVMVKWLQTDKGQGFEIVGKPVSDKKYIGEGIGIAVHKGDKKLLQELNAALAKIIRNGLHRKLARKYFPIDIYPYKNK